MKHKSKLKEHNDSLKKIIDSKAKPKPGGKITTGKIKRIKKVEKSKKTEKVKKK